MPPALVSCNFVKLKAVPSLQKVPRHVASSFGRYSTAEPVSAIDKWLLQRNALLTFAMEALEV